MARGTGDKIKGKLNEVTGALTGNRKREFKGKAQEVKGGVSDEFEDANQDLEEEDEGRSGR